MPQPVHSPRGELLRDRIGIFPDPHFRQSQRYEIDSVRPALPLGQREYGCVVVVGPDAGRIVDGKAGVVTYRGTAAAIDFPIFMSDRKPFARKIDLGQRGNAACGDQHEKQKENNPWMAAVHITLL